MTIKELLYLCLMSYIDLPPLYAGLVSRGGSVPVAALADAVLRMDAAGVLPCVRLDAAAREAARELTGSDWVIIDYINANDSDGFAAYTVRAGDTYVVAMRGSETPGECADSYVDWVDNVCEPFAGSVQLDRIRALTHRFREERVVFTGHSKGGHNALLALAVSENPMARAVAFNGQGFAADALDDEQKAKLRERGTNYVVAEDVVGALLYHPERRVYVKGREGINAHMPGAFTFDEEGSPVKGRRAAGSYAAEAVTRIIEKRLPRTGAAALCRRALGLYGG